MTHRKVQLVAFSTLLCCGTVMADFEYKGNVSLQGQIFTATPDHSADQDGNISGAAEIELYKAIDGNSRSVVFTPFLRVDQHDSDRTHIDIRELLYLQASDNWEFRIGLSRIFWGVAESRNIVDVINQVDQVEGLATDAKLGQPMINFTSVNDWGNLTAYVLPGFRERTFASAEGRPRFSIPIDADGAQYESSDEDRHTDFALRYSTVIDEWDLGVSYFKGTSRDPLLVFSENTLVPFYYLVEQVGLDVQATLESWLLKTELIHRSGNLIENHAEAVTGFEYSFYSVGESNIDVGVVAEYLWDERDSDANSFQNDLLVGLRFALNDEQSSEALLGTIVDLDGDGVIFTLEAERRLGNSFNIAAEATIWSDRKDDGSIAALRNEDYLQLELTYFF